jgi:hypothetical protein
MPGMEVAELRKLANIFKELYLLILCLRQGHYVTQVG